MAVRARVPAGHAGGGAPSLAFIMIHQVRSLAIERLEDLNERLTQKMELILFPAAVT